MVTRLLLLPLLAATGVRLREELLHATAFDLAAPASGLWSGLEARVAGAVRAFGALLRGEAAAPALPEAAAGAPQFRKCTASPAHGACSRPDWGETFALNEMAARGWCTTAEEAFTHWRGPVVLSYNLLDKNIWEVGFLTELLSPVGEDLLLCVVTPEFVRKAARVPAATAVVMSRFDDWSVDLLTKLSPRALLHISDEPEGAQDFSPAYAAVTADGGTVLRQYLPERDAATNFSAFPELVPLPLAPKAFDFLAARRDGTAYCRYARRSAQRRDRPAPWAFVGDLQMALGPGDGHAVRTKNLQELLGDAKLSVSTTIHSRDGAVFSDDQSYTGERLVQLYRSAKLVPSFRGHVALDCLRNYEAVLSGAVPAVCGEGTPGVRNEYAKMFAYAGTPPWILGDDCGQVRREMQELLADPAELQRRRAESAEWFCGYMAKLQDTVRTALLVDSSVDR